MSDEIAPFLEDSKFILKTVTLEKNGKIKRYVFFWIISNYDKLRTDVFYSSHYIKIGEKSHQLHFLKEDFRPPPVVNIYLNLIPRIDDSKSIEFKVLNQDFSYEGTSSDSYTTAVKTCLIRNDQLTIMCTFKVSKVNGLFPEVHLPLIEFKDYLLASENTGDLLTTGQFSDLKVVVGKKVFKVHRAILASRSPVFATMLQTNMKEKIDNKIVIEDSDSKTFYEFLRYIYYGSVKLINEDLAASLLRLADKYGLDELKSNSGTYLACSLSVDNVLDLWKLADLYQEEHLKKSAFQFIADNLSQVMKNPEWSSFRSSGTSVDCLLSIIGERPDVTVDKDSR